MEYVEDSRVMYVLGPPEILAYALKKYLKKIKLALRRSMTT